MTNPLKALAEQRMKRLKMAQAKKPKPIVDMEEQKKLWKAYEDMKADFLLSDEERDAKASTALEALLKSIFTVDPEMEQDLKKAFVARDNLKAILLDRYDPDVLVNLDYELEEKLWYLVVHSTKAEMLKQLEPFEGFGVKGYLSHPVKKRQNISA